MRKILKFPVGLVLTVGVVVLAVLNLFWMEDYNFDKMLFDIWGWVDK